MANKEKLPWDLVEEILSRVPPKPLVRFRIVCKRWNALFDDKAFINNHKSTFRFIFATKSKIYSVNLNPKIEVRELTLDIPGLESENPKSLMECSGLLLYGMGEGAVVWNPWLKQTKWIEPEVNQPSLHFSGIGYDNNSVADDEIVYKTLAIYRKDLGDAGKWKIHDFASDEWEDQLQEAKRITQYRSSTLVNLHSKDSGVSLHGTLYWVTYYLNSNDKADHDPLFFLMSFNFSSKRFLKICYLPCVENDHGDALVFRVFKGDRFSLLKQCHVTKKIEIWVTKNKIRKSGGEDVEWISFMEVSVPNLPDLVPTGIFLSAKLLH